VWWSLALVLGLRPAVALDPHLRITQHSRGVWRAQDGAFEAANSISGARRGPAPERC